MKTWEFVKTCGTVILGIVLSGCANMEGTKNARRPLEIKSPISREVTRQPLTIQGEIPDWLEGTFVRNGPVSLEVNNQKIAHWFDGLAMLHAFTFKSGQVTYTNKYLKTDAYQTVFMKGSLDYLGFDSLPPHPFWDKITAFFNPMISPPLQNANVNVTKIADNYVALTEIPLPVHFDIHTLETRGALSFQDNLPQKNVFESAHPQYDRRRGEQFNYIVDYGLRSQYLLYRYHTDFPGRQLIGKVPVSKPAYMHSFALTEHYIILVEFPLIVNPINLFFLNKPFIENYHWQPSRGTNFIVINRKTGKVVKEICDGNPFFAFHHVNAYEEEDKVILDIVTYPNAKIVSSISEHGYLYSHLGKDEELPLPKLMRYHVNLLDESIRSTILYDGVFELPRINEKYQAYDYRYAYGSDQRLFIQLNDQRPIYKVDVKTGKTLSWDEPGVLPGEPVFIGKPNSTNEDDGVIISIMFDVKKQKAFLLLLDATHFKEIGRIYAPVAIPLGLHGQFFKIRGQV